MQTIGTMQLIKPLGSGGMAEAWLARDSDDPDGKLIVVKRLHPQLAARPDSVAMFLDEGTIASRLDHPNIVQTTAPTCCDDVWLMVMEYVDGYCLRDLVAKAEEHKLCMPPSVAVYIAAAAARGLAHAHERCDPESGEPMAIVHRDITPGNILVGRAGAVKITDFGVAMAVGRRAQTRIGQRKGTAAYMSPEQVQVQAVDHRSDLYSLGVVLYELLTHRPMHGDMAEYLLLQRIVHGEVQPPSEIVPMFGSGLEELCLELLAKEPAKRPKTAAATADCLERWLRDQGHKNPVVRLQAWLTQLGLA